MEINTHACCHDTGQAFFTAEGLCTLPHKAQLQCIYMYTVNVEYRTGIRTN